MNNVRVLSVSTSGYIQAGRVLNRAPGQLCSLCCYVVMCLERCVCFQMVVNNTKPNNREHAERALCWYFDSIAFHSHETGVLNFYFQENH